MLLSHLCQCYPQTLSCEKLWKLVNVTKKSLLTLLKCQPSPYPPTEVTSGPDFYTQSVAWSNMWTYVWRWVFCIPKCYYQGKKSYKGKVCVSVRGQQICVSPEKVEKNIYKNSLILWKNHSCILLNIALQPAAC